MAKEVPGLAVARGTQGVGAAFVGPSPVAGPPNGDSFAIMWFAVHVLIGHSDAESTSGEIVVEESVCVVDCDTAAEAERLGAEIAERYAQTKISYLDPRPSKVESMGVRRVVVISNPDLGADAPPRHETEITYEIMKFANRQDLENYREGVSINATFWEEPQ
ncbi:hypothetical protein [Bosea sp. (in: a-proteobacteria)]|uniref:hypothetical protein n=1 Tax=Bosea sp. (in: a-proteobacteria) TaxID=1871050 RepID=UPI002635BD11|nr:hypothetical protein [Bosea sp. (in: a-proteobacteria)]MCO5091506.1 hypothetical protein [Bosea sp. (in: a-proteobacteria)]